MKDIQIKTAHISPPKSTARQLNNLYAAVNVLMQQPGNETPLKYQTFMQLTSVYAALRKLAKKHGYKMHDLHDEAKRQRKSK